MSERIDTHTHDPNETLDYQIDWSRALDEGDTIDEVAWTVTPQGPEIEDPAPSHTDTTSTCWFSGGTAGTNYVLEATVTTAGGRVLQGHLLMMVR